MVPFESITHVNLTDRVYDAIKQRILSSQFEVGSKLRDETLAQQLGVSRTPVREAILRLSREGLVEVIPRSGTRVRTFTEQDIEEIFELRIALETLAIRKAATRLARAQVRRLRDMHEQAEAALKKGDTTLALVFDSEMHRTILEASGNQRLQKMMSTITDFVVLFRNIGAHTPFHRGFTYRHRDIVRALDRRDPDIAARVLAEHIEVAKLELVRDFHQRRLLEPVETSGQAVELLDRSSGLPHRRVRRTATHGNTSRSGHVR